MSLFDQTILISYTFDDEMLNLFGIDNKERLTDTLTMVFNDNNKDINVNLAFIKELMDETTISRDEAIILAYQAGKIYSEIEYLRQTIQSFNDN